MIRDLIILLIGFTLFSSAIAATAYLFFLPDMRKSTGSKFAAFLMLLVLSGLQTGHYLYFDRDIPALDSRLYLVFLLTAPPAFYAFSRVVIFADRNTNRETWIHFFWPLMALILPIESIPVVAFVIGTGYTFWFARILLGMRDHRNHFHFEFFFFAMFAAMALAALLLALALPYINHDLYYLIYSLCIGTAMFLIIGALIIFPERVADIMRRTEQVYAKSHLKDVNVPRLANKLNQLLEQDEVYQNENLSLATLAELVELTPHQLSELINRHFGVGFPRFVRESRVKIAQRLLLAEPQTSILAISMMTGFKSQSSFYTAFKEVVGESPGGYRNRHKA